MKTQFLKRIISLSFITVLPFAAIAAQESITYKSAQCGCCTEWVDYMEKNGFDIIVEDRNDMAQIKEKLGIHPTLASCHTTVIDGYVFEGHIPASDIKDFLSEKPKLSGLAVPGMPIGSPGMEYGDRKDPYNVIGFTESGMTTIFSQHNK